MHYFIVMFIDLAWTMYSLGVRLGVPYQLSLKSLSLYSYRNILSVSCLPCLVSQVANYLKLAGQGNII